MTGEMPTLTLWNRMNESTAGLLEEALESIEERSHSPLNRGTRKRDRCELLQMLEKDEAWLRVCGASSAWAIATLPAFSRRMCSNDGACANVSLSPCRHLSNDHVSSLSTPIFHASLLDVQGTPADEAMLSFHEVLPAQNAGLAGLERHTRGIIDHNSIFGFQSMLVAQPAFIRR